MKINDYELLTGSARDCDDDIRRLRQLLREKAIRTLAATALGRLIDADEVNNLLRALRHR